MPLIAGFGPDGPVFIVPAAAPAVRLIAGITPAGGPRFLTEADAARSRVTLVHNRDPKTAAGPKAAAGPAVKFGPAETTVGPKGIVVARFATLDTIDLDGDVIVPGAVGTGQDVVISSWNHGSWEKGTPMLPVGTGRVAEEGRFLVLRGQFFMDTTAGRETFLTLRGLAERGRWSFGFNIAVGGADRGPFGPDRTYVRFLRRLSIEECAPVLRAAGIGTATVELSSLDHRQLMLAQAAHDNERKLRELLGWVPERRKPVGYHPTSGTPVYASAGAGGRK